MNAAETIKAIREALRFTQTQFCTYYNHSEPTDLKIDQPLLSKYETGDVVPPGDKMLKFLSLAPKVKPTA